MTKPTPEQVEREALRWFGLVTHYAPASAPFAFCKLGYMEQNRWRTLAREVLALKRQAKGK